MSGTNELLACFGIGLAIGFVMGISIGIILAFVAGTGVRREK